MKASVQVGILALWLPGAVLLQQEAVASDLPASGAGQVPHVAGEDEEKLPDFSFTLPHATLGCAAGLATPGEPLVDYVGRGVQLTTWLSKTVWESGGALRLFMTLGYRYVVFDKSLNSPIDITDTPVSRLSAYNLDLLAGASYLVQPEFMATAEIGPVLQRRTFSISNDETSYLGDDYYAGTALGTLLRISGHYLLPGDNSIGFHYALEQGPHLFSPRLKYNGKRVDINERQNAWGIDIAHDF